MTTAPQPIHFIRNIILNDINNGKNCGRVITRFPPEPNGFLHIGHAKSICLNFGIAADFNGCCYLRLDDTNPSKEETQYIDSIQQDVRWLGFDWHDRLRYASSYFQQLYDYAVELINKGHAYVCNLSIDAHREYRGTLTTPGQDSPYRTRTIAENRQLFAAMRAGEFADGTHVLRAKIDMASPNLNMRDPTIYRIRRITHHQTGDNWCIYPMYDFAHCLSDAIEGITHSLCTLEFEDHRPLYDWFLEQLDVPCHPQQIEFSRLNLEYTVTSKRKLNQLVTKGHVDAWDDPRMPTISGLKRRGYTPQSIRTFCDRIGITKSSNTIEMELLESCIREQLESTAKRVLAVLRPLRVVITNYPETQEEMLSAKNHPQIDAMGTREIPFSRIIYIDQNDFRETANKKFKRLVQGGEVRLRYAYIIKCEQVIKNAAGEIVELQCRYDSQTLGTNPTDRKVKGVIHWVSARHAITAEVRLYDRLFNTPNPGANDDIEQIINENSLEIIHDCRLEPCLANAVAGDAYQFEREGYFCLDAKSSETTQLQFNRTVTLRDSWAKIESRS